MKEEAKAKLELIEQQEKCLAEQKAKLLEELNKKEPGWFVPEIGKTYFYLTPTGYAERLFENNPIDNVILSNLIVCETEAEIIRDDNKRKATIKYLKAIAKENDGWRPDWGNHNQFKWAVFYAHDDKCIDINGYRWTQSKDSHWYSVSKEAAQRAVSVLTDEEIELVFNS